MQSFKSVYFPDHPSTRSQERHIKIAFGKEDVELREAVQGLSSADIRKLIGIESHADLLRVATEQQLPVNTVCIRELRRSYNAATREGSTFPLPGFMDFGPFDATYKSGRSTAIDRWFPLTESFSREFVTKIIRTYMPNAKTLLDPFGGLGTTPLTASELGINAFYCEVNPVFQFVLDAKVAVLCATNRRRAALAHDLEELSTNVSEQLLQIEPSIDLELSLQTALGSTRFFSPTQYDWILRARKFQDLLISQDPLLGSLWGVAVISALVPASEMKRSGDLRYRRPNEAHQHIPLPMGIEKNLRDISDDIKEIKHTNNPPRLLTCDARDLNKLPAAGIEGVVTSPPYLNGTNYCRNTKLEAWYLRFIRTSEDLKRLRLSAIVAGINGVHKEYKTTTPTEAVSVVTSLETDIYDKRIPRMVAAYFADLDAVFDGVSRHLSTNAVIAVDIGDSSYGGHHIPTDDILSRVLVSKGYQPLEKIRLRNRLSRSGMPLSQYLMIFRRGVQSVKSGASKSDHSWETAWRRFTTVLPHRQLPFNKRNWGHNAHSLCSYMGKLKPSIAHHLVHSFVPTGGSVLDPFAGVGTIPFEAGVHGCQSWGFEISPAALAIALGKCGEYTAPAVQEVLADLCSFVNKERANPEELVSANQIKFNGRLTEYFHHDTFQEVVVARRYFKTLDLSNPSVAFVLACTLHVLHGNRPYAASRNSHPLTPFAPTGPREYRNLLERVGAKVKRALRAEKPKGFIAGEIMWQDATEAWPQQVTKLDAIITSPPFFDSTRFHMANWMRLWFSGWDQADFGSLSKRFIDERQKESLDVYRPVFRQARERLKPGSPLVLHLGKSHKCDMGQALSEVAKPWFNTFDLYNEDVGRIERHGVTDKGTVTSHQYLVLV